MRHMRWRKTMSRELKVIMNNDGVFEEYDDTYDITIHLESEEEQDRIIEWLNKMIKTGGKESEKV